MPRKRTNNFKKYINTPGLFIGLGVFLMLVNGVHSIFRDQALALTQNVAQQYQESTVTRPAQPSHIFIRWFLDVDITPALYKNGVWGVSANTASYLAQSARPGEKGNIILYGHNKREILGNIRALKGGEEIELTSDDGQKHLYKVISFQEVRPTDTKLLDPTDHEVLTIYTCSGLLDSQRFIVRAEPK